jgi:hypothetical protein
MRQRVNGKPMAPAGIWELQDGNGCLIIPDQTTCCFNQRLMRGAHG